MVVHVVQQSRRFSNFNQPLLKFLERLMQKGLLQPLPNPNPNTLDYNPNKHCKFHQNLKHSTDNCIRLKHEIQNLIDAGRIIDPENSSIKNNPFPNYNTMMINSGVSEEEVLNSFGNINLQTNENAPNASKRSQKGVEDLLGQPSGKFDYKVFYIKPPFLIFLLSQSCPEDGVKSLMMRIYQMKRV